MHVSRLALPRHFPRPIVSMHANVSPISRSSIKVRFQSSFAPRWETASLDAMIALQCALGTNSRTKRQRTRTEEHTSELQSLMLIPYALFSLKKKTMTNANRAYLLQTWKYITGYAKTTCKL